jgi:hypothetical protein
MKKAPSIRQGPPPNTTQIQTTAEGGSEKSQRHKLAQLKIDALARKISQSSAGKVYAAKTKRVVAILRVREATSK